MVSHHGVLSRNGRIGPATGKPMKLLMIYSTRFGWTPGHRTLDSVPEAMGSQCVEDVLVGLVHVEADDLKDPHKVETKLVKNLKWAARKNETQRILLHSFSHLAETKADPDFTCDLLQRATDRLVNAGYEALQTPFGYFLNLDLAAPGVPAARIFVSF